MATNNIVTDRMAATKTVQRILMICDDALLFVLLFLVAMFSFVYVSLLQGIKYLIAKVRIIIDIKAFLSYIYIYLMCESNKMFCLCILQSIEY